MGGFASIMMSYGWVSLFVIGFVNGSPIVMALWGGIPIAYGYLM